MGPILAVSNDAGLHHALLVMLAVLQEHQRPCKGRDIRRRRSQGPFAGLRRGVTPRTRQHGPQARSQCLSHGRRAQIANGVGRRRDAIRSQSSPGDLSVHSARAQCKRPSPLRRPRRRHSRHSGSESLQRSNTHCTRLLKRCEAARAPAAHARATSRPAHCARCPWLLQPGRRHAQRVLEAATDRQRQRLAQRLVRECDGLDGADVHRRERPVSAR